MQAREIISLIGMGNIESSWATLRHWDATFDVGGNLPSQPEPVKLDSVQCFLTHPWILHLWKQDSWPLIRKFIFGMLSPNVQLPERKDALVTGIIQKA